MSSESAPASSASDSLRSALSGVDSLLSFDVYEAFHDVVATDGPNLALEIGTAHGAATIALALGSLSSGKSLTIFTVDTFASTDYAPSSRAKFGDEKSNLAIVQAHFRRVGIEKLINVFVGSSDDFAEQIRLPEKIDLLLLDADGRIDRDLLLFRECLQDDAMIIIDDIDGQPNIIRNAGRRIYDLKHVISSKLLNELVAGEFLQVEKVIGSTAFCRAKNPTNWSSEDLTRIALGTYRELVFTDHPGILHPVYQALGKAIKRAPFSRHYYPALRRAVRGARGR